MNIHAKLAQYRIGLEIKYKVSQCNDSPSPLTISKHEETQQQIFCGTKVFVNQSVNMVGQGGQCLHLIR